VVEIRGITEAVLKKIFSPKLYEKYQCKKRLPSYGVRALNLLGVTDS
jgi:hypothetical protein